MRNIKRILAMSLATVMLCASMVVGSAASFNDADKIVNTEAVTVTTGLGIFAGTTDGNFNPTGTTTRAQMAAVIVKMLYGSDINADQFKGASKFSDVADFEGGWAEGYINLCSNLGVIAGYPDGTFKPGAAVTTAEATTMIINALKVDAGNGTWPLTVMAKAEEMKLFAELAVKPLTNDALTRDALASVVFEAIQYSPSKTTGYSIPGSNIIFENYVTAYLANGSKVEGIVEVVGEDTIANEIFNLNSTIGFIVANQATGADCTVIVNGDKTTELNIETGLDAIGHYVTAYYAETYKSDINPGIAYAIVDEAEYVVVDERGVDTKKEYREYFGNQTFDEAVKINYVDGNYQFNPKGQVIASDFYTANPTKDNDLATGTYMIYDGKLIGYFAEPTTTISRVSRISKDSITIAGPITLSNSEDEDKVVEYEGIAKDDIVIITKAGELTYITKADCVIGEITRTSTNEFGEAVIAIGDKTYTAYDGDPSIVDLTNTITKDIFNKNFEIYTIGDKFIGWKNVGSTADVSDVVYVIDVYDVTTTNNYGIKVIKTYAQGIDVNGKEVTILVNDNSIKFNDGDDYTIPVIEKNAFYTFETSTHREVKKYDVMIGEEVATKTEYEEANKNTNFYEFYYDATGVKQTLKRDDYIVKTNSGIAFITENTKFIVFEGEKATLETVVYTGPVSRTFTNADAIFSVDNNGNVLVEIVVINDTVNVAGEDLIYIFDTNGATTIDGIEMDVYFTDSNSVKNITADKAYGVGFYSYTYDATENIYELTAAAGDAVLADRIFKNYLNGYIVATDINGVKATDAKIFDARLDDKIEDSDISRIETFDDMTDATKAEYKITFSAITNDDGEIVNIIITSVKDTNASI